VSTEDAQLVRRILDGDGAAFAAVVDRYAGLLTSVAGLRLGNREDARDVVQQSFFTAYRRLPRLRDPSKLGGWLRGIAVNLSRRVAKRRKREREGTPRAAPPDPARDPVSAAARSEDASRIGDVLSRLDEAHREALVLHHVEGLGVREVSELLDRPAGTVKRLLFEARERLRGELIEMAREEFEDYRLTDGQRERLACIPTFPRREPLIETTRLDDEAPEVLALAPSAVFPALAPGAETAFATYDHPGGKLTSISHVRVEGPVEVEGRPALRYDHVDFGPDGNVEWSWMPCYRAEGEMAVYCAKSFGSPGETPSLILPDDEDWGEAAPRPETLRLVPGKETVPGPVVDRHLWSVKIGRRTQRCVRRVFGSEAREVDWSETPVTDAATEEFLLPDGRLLLFRRYNGTEWTAANPARSSHEAGWFENLAGLPEIEVFGHTFRLWYDQVPAFALA
jgi:RNA polymerase sigma-70 factor (ECF subfamily)